MLLNAYAVLDLFLIILRCLVGLLVLALCVLARWRGRGSHSPEDKTWLEDQGYLLLLLTFLLLGLNFLSWPFFYLLLQSYVTEWPGVMCIYGVTQIGAGSLGASRFLPELVRTLQWTKPLLVFLGGAWFVLYLVNRQTPTAPLRNRLLLALTLLGWLAVADAVVEAAYLIIPKKEEFLSVGCCTAVLSAQGQASRFEPQAWLGLDYHVGLSAAYYGINLAMVLGLWLGTRSLRTPARPALALLFLGALISVPVSALFLKYIAAPTLLHMPHHYCPYDLLPLVPESALGIGMFFLGCFAVGWACLVGWLGRGPETQAVLGNVVRNVLLVGLLGYLASVVMMFLELILA